MAHPPARRPGKAVRLALAVAALVAALGAPGVDPPVRAGDAPGGLRVAGDRLVDGDGRPVRLRGVNRAGTEYACVQGWGIFDGPHDARAVAAMRAWGVNAVRVPLNEHCWLGLPGIPAAYGGAAYRAAIADWVATLRAAGMYVILDLHWAAPAGAPADRLRPMPDRDHAPAFWRQVAAAYGGDGAVLFDLFNEPYPDRNADSAEAWRCWRDGGACAGVGYPAAGMQELVDAVRGAGATNVILLAGVQYANSFSRFRTHAPRDPLGNLAASWHAYNFMITAVEPAWDARVGIPTARVPLVATELGQDDCGDAFLLRALRWLDAREAGYLGWTWNTWGRCDGSAAPLAAEAAPPGALVLYDDVAPAPFLTVSFGVNAQDPCDRRTRAGGRCAYALALGPWGGFGVERAGGFATAGYDRLSFAFRVDGEPLASFAIALVAQEGGRAIRAVPLDQALVEAELGDGWVRLAVPLGALNPAGVAARGVVLRNVAGWDLRAAHLDGVWLVPGLGAALPTGARAAR